MFHLTRCFGLGILAIALLVGASAPQDTKKEEKKAKGQLPPGFKDLGLSAEQKGKIYTIISEYKVKLAELDKQIKELKKQEQKEMFKVLTDDQQKKYLEAKGLEVKKKEDKKEPDKK